MNNVIGVVNGRCNEDFLFYLRHSVILSRELGIITTGLYNESMKILVTGAAGFVGSNLSEYLLGQGHTVVGVDNFDDYYNPKIKEYHVKDFEDDEKFSLHRIDILEEKALKEVFEKEGPLDAIVHLAARAGVTASIDFPAVYVRNNIEGTVNLAELAVKHNVDNFIFASTSSIYGDSPVPFSEDTNTDHPLAPYPATKKACEVMLSTYTRNFGLNVGILRIFNPNGKRMRPDLALPKMIRSCEYGVEFPRFFTDEEATKTGRDYCYIEHIFEAISALLYNTVEYEIFNVGNSSPVTLTELVEIVNEVTGKKVNVVTKPHRQGEMKVTYANIDKAKKMLNYNPSTQVKEIVKLYYNWFIQQEEWYKKGDF